MKVMNRNEIASAIARLPLELQLCPDGLSTSEYIRRCLYPEIREAVDVVSLKYVLSQDLSLVDLWLVYSSDKRTGSGWFFRRTTNNLFEVGHYNASGHYDQSSVFDSSLDACAVYIKHEVDEILALHLS